MNSGDGRRTAWVLRPGSQGHGDAERRRIQQVPCQPSSAPNGRTRWRWNFGNFDEMMVSGGTGYLLTWYPEFPTVSLARVCSQPPRGQGGHMAHGRDKPKKEKRKPKKEKQTLARTGRDADVLDHVRQHT